MALLWDRLSSRSRRTGESVPHSLDDVRREQTIQPVNPTEKQRTRTLLAGNQAIRRVGKEGEQGRSSTCRCDSNQTRAHHTQVYRAAGFSLRGVSSCRSVRPTETLRLTVKRSKRSGRDSNPRYACAHTAFPVRPLQPLGHRSNGGRDVISTRQWA